MAIDGEAVWESVGGAAIPVDHMNIRMFEVHGQPLRVNASRLGRTLFHGPATCAPIKKPSAMRWAHRTA
jgi:hypothetical protein